MKKIPIALTLLVATTLVLAACTPAAPSATPTPTTAPDLLDDIMTRGSLRVSTDPNYAPQSFLNEKGELDGFDVDVAKEVAKRLGVKVEFVTPDWDTIVSGNWGDRWDISIGSMTITTDRQQVLYFTPPYYYTPAQFAVPQDSTLTSVDDLNGKGICVGAGTTYESYLRNDGSLSLVGEKVIKQVTGAKVTTLPTDAECAQAWQAGRKDFDAWLTSSTTVQGAIDQGIKIKFLGDPVFYEDLAVAIDKKHAKDATRLVAKLTDIVNGMHSDGTLSSLSNKWYKLDLTTKK
jgi:polar amino acid transport system substrate-binding protein